MTKEQLKDNIKKRIMAVVPEHLRKQLTSNDFQIDIQDVTNEGNISSKVLISVSINIVITNPELINASQLKTAIDQYVERHNEHSKETRKRNLTQTGKTIPIFIKSHQITTKAPDPVQTPPAQPVVQTPVKVHVAPPVGHSVVTIPSTNVTVTNSSDKSKPLAPTLMTAKPKSEILLRKINTAIQALNDQKERLERIKEGSELGIWERITTWIASFFPKNDKLIDDKIEALDSLIKITNQQDQLIGFNYLARCVENPNTAEDQEDSSEVFASAPLVRVYCNTLNQKRIGFLNTQSYDTVSNCFSSLKTK